MQTDVFTWFKVLLPIFEDFFFWWFLVIFEDFLILFKGQWRTLWAIPEDLICNFWGCRRVFFCWRCNSLHWLRLCLDEPLLATRFLGFFRDQVSIWKWNYNRSCQCYAKWRHIRNVLSFYYFYSLIFIGQLFTSQVWLLIQTIKCLVYCLVYLLVDLIEFSVAGNLIDKTICWALWLCQSLSECCYCQLYFYWSFLKSIRKPLKIEGEQ